MDTGSVIAGNGSAPFTVQEVRIDKHGTVTAGLLPARRCCVRPKVDVYVGYLQAAHLSHPLSLFAKMVKCTHCGKEHEVSLEFFHGTVHHEATKFIGKLVASRM